MANDCDWTYTVEGYAPEQPCPVRECLRKGPPAPPIAGFGVVCQHTGSLPFVWSVAQYEPPARTFSQSPRSVPPAPKTTDQPAPPSEPPCPGCTCPVMTRWDGAKCVPIELNA